MIKANLLNKKFGSLLVIDYYPNIEYKHRKSTRWFCLCDCGKTIAVTSYLLKSNQTKSCGCLKIKRLKENHSEKHYAWKKDKPTLRSLHRWVRGRIGVPEKCSKCGSIAKLDLANISQNYERNLTDWEYLCRKCHMTKDGRIERLVKNSVERIKNGII